MGTKNEKVKSRRWGTVGWVRMHWGINDMLIYTICVRVYTYASASVSASCNDIFSMGEKATNCCNVMALGSNKHSKCALFSQMNIWLLVIVVDDEAKKMLHIASLLWRLSLNAREPEIVSTPHSIIRAQYFNWSYSFSAHSYPGPCCCGNNRDPRTAIAPDPVAMHWLSWRTQTINADRK